MMFTITRDLEALDLFLERRLDELQRDHVAHKIVLLVGRPTPQDLKQLRLREEQRARLAKQDTLRWRAEGLLPGKDMSMRDKRTDGMM